MSEFETLLSLVETLAALRAEGRLTLRRYAGGWRIALGHGDVLTQPVHPTLVDAVRALLIDQTVVTEP